MGTTTSTTAKSTTRIIWSNNSSRGNGHISANKLEFAVVFHLGAERAYTFWPFLATNATIAQELGDESLHCRHSIAEVGVFIVGEVHHDLDDLVRDRLSPC